MNKFIITIITLIMGLSGWFTASAYDFEVDGVYYNVLSLEDMTCEVTYNPAKKYTGHWEYHSEVYSGCRCRGGYPTYAGNVTIPETVGYKGRSLSVVGIGEWAFFGCGSLTALSLPGSVGCCIDDVRFSNYTDIVANPFDYCKIENLSVGAASTLDVFCSPSDTNNKDSQTKANLRVLTLAGSFYGNIGVDFSSFTKLESIESYSRNVPAFTPGTHFSNEQYLNTEVWVPEEAFAAYQSADVWKDFWELKPMKSVKSISLNQTSLNLKPAQTFRLVSTIVPADAYNSAVVWESSNPEVATVDANGVVTAVTKGDAIISVKATDGSGVSKECAVHVDILVESIQLSDAEFGLEPGNTRQLQLSIQPDDAFVKDVIWSSDNENVATVDQQGSVTAKNKGVANISVRTTDGSNLTASCKVTVATLVKSISVTPQSTNINAGETVQLHCAVTPESADNKNVIWDSADEDVAKVNPDGLVTAISSGVVTIRATAADGAGVYGECELTVSAVTFENNGICYQTNSASTLKIVANSDCPYAGDFVIPSAVRFDGHDRLVTEIGAGAFDGCDELTSLVIPASVTKIRENAFDGCSQLSYVKICNGSTLAINLDNVFPDSPVQELYVGSDALSYNTDSRLLGSIKGMTLGNTVKTFPPAAAFNSLRFFVVEDSDAPISEPDDYCTRNQSLVNKMTVRDPDTLIYYKFFYLVTYSHLAPIIHALENSCLNYVHIGREVESVEVDTSVTQKIGPTTAGSRYQEFGYRDEFNYQYTEMIAIKDYNRKPVETIAFDREKVELDTGESIKMALVFTPADASFTAVEWTTSDENVAVVDAFGNVTKMSEGEAVITATTTDGTNLSASCAIVNPVVVEDVSLNETALTLIKGTSFQLLATVSPDGTVADGVKWSSSAPAVASVSEAGLVTANAPGYATISATCREVSAVCEVEVKEEVGIEDVSVDADCVTEMYNLQGVKLNKYQKHLAPGVYVRLRGTHAEKVVIK